MPFIRKLSEKLEAQKMYDGMMGKYETRFKVDGFEYALLATSVGGDYSDNTSWMLEFENIKSHRIGTGDSNPAVAKAFGEAVDQWVKEKNPTAFYTYGSSIEPLIKIIEAVKKKVKKYNLIDDTAEKKNEENGEVIEGNPVGKITWTKVVELEAVDTMDREALVGDKFEEPEVKADDPKTNKAYLSGTSKTDKLDKGDKAYDKKTESFTDFKSRKLNEVFSDEEFDDDDAPDDFVDRLPTAAPKNIDDGEGQPQTAETAKSNVLNLVARSVGDMRKVVAQSERPDEIKATINSALDSFVESLDSREEDEFLELQGYTGDKNPDVALKKVFGALQKVIKSQEDDPGTVEDMLVAFTDELDNAIGGGFQQSTATVGVAKRNKIHGVDVDGLPSREFLQNRMKELGM